MQQKRQALQLRDFRGQWTKYWQSFCGVCITLETMWWLSEADRSGWGEQRNQGAASTLYHIKH